MSILSLLSSSAQGSAKTYIEDVFSAYTYTGNGSTQTITNGIDLAGEGGLVWLKGRSAAGYGNQLYDTARGATKQLTTNNTNAQSTEASGLTSFSSSGFSIGSYVQINDAATYVSWTFRKAPRFFDVVTYTGNGVTTGRQISHNLGGTVGFVVVKRTDTTDNWKCWHRGTTSGRFLQLNTTDAEISSGAASTFGNGTSTVDPTSSVFTVGSDLNANLGTYVAYLFAHDTSADGLIQCGSFTTDGSGNATVTLGWEPQFLTLKSSNAVTNWSMFDTARGLPVQTGGSSVSGLIANGSNAEATLSIGSTSPTATGFTFTGSAASRTYIYLAIRRGPMRSPTSGTQVYQAIARTGTGAPATVTGVGFPPDLILARDRNNVQDNLAFDRLRGANSLLRTSATSAENNTYSNLITAYNMDGFDVGSDANGWGVNISGRTVINWCLRRYPQVFDQVCYTGTGSTGLVVNHNLGVVPELTIFKSRSGVRNWEINYAFTSTQCGRLQMTSSGGSTGSYAGSGIAHSAQPTATQMTLTGSANAPNTNTASDTVVAYLFATKAGISKVFSYTGNGTSQTIDCGFAAGARLVIIKRTDSTGDWKIWDSVRGIIAGNDPFLRLNSTANESTAFDTIDPDASGFIVNQDAQDMNVSSATYIGIAFA